MGLVAEALHSAFDPACFVRQQGPLDLGRWSLPRPDVSVVPGAPRDYSVAFPTTALLVAEVGESSLRFDHTVKAWLYARAGVADYWIVNLVDRQLEVRRNPGPDPLCKGRYRYADVTIVPASGTATPLAAPGAVIAVADLLP
jgi:Uma2 family endonuclease